MKRNKDKINIKKSANDINKKIKRKHNIKRKQKINRNQKILHKLLLAFSVSIILMIILGVFSYNVASKSVMNKYQESVNSTVKAMSQYFDLMCDNVESRVNEQLNNENLTQYYTKYFKKPTAESMPLFRSARTSIENMKGTTDYIQDFHVFSENGNPMTSSAVVIPPNAYTEFMKAEGNIFEDGKVKAAWLGNHTYLDSIFGKDSNSYGIYYVKRFIKGNGFVVIDIKNSSITNLFQSMNMEEKSITALITQDGKEVIASNQETDNTAFINESFYKASIGKESGSNYITHNKEKYLYAYAPVGSTNMMICTLIPKSEILGAVSSIRINTFIFVVFAVIIAGFIGGILATNISKVLKKISKALGKVADGDFTVEVSTNRKDEFYLLTESIHTTLQKIRLLMAEVKGFGYKVSVSAEDVSKTSASILIAMQDVSKAVDEVASGIVTQATDADHGLQKMSSFSDKINLVYENTELINNIADQTTRSIEDVKKIIQELTGKVETTSNLTHHLVNDIVDVSEQSNNIGSIVETIREIASQTNLLSLNASIEAARAGAEGRGFAVVAEEIRKLADQSSVAGDQIKVIVDKIQEKTKKTAKSARETETNMKSQTNSLEGTIHVFGEMNEYVENLVDKLKVIISSIEEISSSKDDVLASIRNVSEVSEESAASTEEVMATITDQVSSISQLTEAAEQLMEESKQLENLINKFIL
jgi:methyl-accepting chemotaxis protein